jgi:hypothetical protein
MLTPTWLRDTIKLFIKIFWDLKKAARWEKKSENYLDMFHLPCAWITFRAA